MCFSCKVIVLPLNFLPFSNLYLFDKHKWINLFLMLLWTTTHSNLKPLSSLLFLVKWNTFLFAELSLDITKLAKADNKQRAMLIFNILRPLDSYVVLKRTISAKKNSRLYILRQNVECFVQRRFFLLLIVEQVSFKIFFKWTFW